MTKPAGVRISNTIELYLTGPERSQAARALQMIDRVHGDGELPLTQIVKGPIYNRWAMEYDPVINRITVNTGQISNFEFKILHEAAHILDFQVFGHGKGYGSESANPDMAELFEAIRRSDAYKKLSAVLDHGFLIRNKPMAVEDLLKERELFARCYAQYITIRSCDHVLLAQLNYILEQDAIRDIVYQWSISDFKPIGNTIDRMFGRKKWIR